MVFSPLEMVTLYHQAKDKKKQIAIFCHTEGMKQEDIIRILKENGVTDKQLPRGERKDKGRKKIAADAIKGDDDRSMEDEVIARVDAERAVKSADPEAKDPTSRIIQFVHEMKASRDDAKKKAQAFLDLADRYEHELQKIADAIGDKT